SSQFRHRPGARVRLASDHASGKQAPAPPNRSRQVANRDTRVQPLPVRPFPQSPVWPRSIAQRTEKRPDWLAVCAVPSEPRSAQFSLLTGKLTAILAISAGRRRHVAKIGRSESADARALSADHPDVFLRRNADAIFTRR